MEWLCNVKDLSIQLEPLRATYRGPAGHGIT